MGSLGGTQCAPYEVLQEWKDENVELRSYPVQNWVCTQATSHRMDDMSSSGFFKLFNYIRGNNDKNQKIAMTKPVLIESKPDPESARNRIFKMGFYMSATDCPSPPEPKANDVFIEQRQAMKVYCRVYAGFSNDRKLNEEARQLGSSLDRLGKHYQTDAYFFAGYDPPFRLFNRRNEVWFLALPDS
ncbi:hypothetical protein CRM22_011190 [Opisthorchis felineus]|uniref:Heme-binding protein 1 n=1 Tax=Opisthorchis felineus TaxID=147828 RepID=A0A4S2K5S9_OPIFE|nr:hypothetical protein CRM22_011190 [Opisthorchis felineus]